MPKRSDKTNYTTILAEIISGMSVRKACDKHNVLPSTFVQSVDAEQYARARDAQADAHFEEMADLEEQCREGLLDPQTFRALLDSRKWRLARMRPTVYGDKMAVENTGEISIKWQK